MKQYTSITVIYNPNSTGGGRELAKAFIDNFIGTRYEHVAKIIETNYAGHAEALAYELAKGDGSPLIISSSGDGGYHEVINGAMRAKLEGASPVTGVLPAGNASDHYRNIHKNSVAEMVLSGALHTIDLLALQVQSPEGAKWTRYAHSYIGVGLTPVVGRELNIRQLNWLNEKLIALKSLIALRPVELIVGDNHELYDSLLISNVADMSKFIGLSKKARLDDGKFEITRTRHASRFRLFVQLFKAATIGLKGREQATSFSFKTTSPTLIQMDGEVKKLSAGDTVSATIIKGGLICVA